jgi:putative copper export protein
VLGIAPALRSPLEPERRAALVARLVNGFSPLALASVAVLAFLGVNAAFRELPTFDALWTTPYGCALLVKLAVVSVVLGFGAWNWRRQKPRLGTEAGARSIRRTATVELALAGLVLLVTSVLVGLPEPRESRGDGPARTPPATSPR